MDQELRSETRRIAAADLEAFIARAFVAVGIPAGAEPPIVLDMATTVAAYGKVKSAAQRGETVTRNG